MSKASRNFRQDVAVSFHTLSSAPGATALLITGNKGNFIHIWLSPTFLGREGKKKMREENMHVSHLYLPVLHRLWSKGDRVKAE